MMLLGQSMRLGIGGMNEADVFSERALSLKWGRSGRDPIVVLTLATLDHRVATMSLLGKKPAILLTFADDRDDKPLMPGGSQIDDSGIPDQC